MRRRPLLIAIAVAALAVWLACVVIALDAHWYFSCTQNGERIGGIDCLDSIPKTDSRPAGSIGFVPLAVAWLVALLTLTACAWRGFRGRRRPLV